MYDSVRNDGSRSDRPGFERLVERARRFLATRTADHWLMFAAGLVLGLLLG